MTTDEHPPDISPTVCVEPGTSHDSNSAPALISTEDMTSNMIEPPTADPAVQELDGIALEILGEDPTKITVYGKEIQKDLAVRLEHCATNGLTKETRKDLKEKYLTPSNCTLIEPPVLNAEIKAALTDVVAKRDKAIETKQGQLTTAISCLSEAITHLFAMPDKDQALLKLLMDTIRILCDCQHADSLTRKNFILFQLKKDMKAQLEKTKIDKFLFSETLSDTIKSAKAIQKSSTDLRPALVQKPIVKKPAAPTQQQHLNYKGPPPQRRRQGGQRTREPAAALRPPPPPPPTRYRQPTTTSSRPSYQRPYHNRR